MSVMVRAILLLLLPPPTLHAIDVCAVALESPLNTIHMTAARVFATAEEMCVPPCTLFKRTLAATSELPVIGDELQV